MTQQELLYLVFEALLEKLGGVGDGGPFVGLQGDKIVVMQSGGEHYAITCVPATVGAPA